MLHAQDNSSLAIAPALLLCCILSTVVRNLIESGIQRKLSLVALRLSMCVSQVDVIISMHHGSSDCRRQQLLQNFLPDVLPHASGILLFWSRNFATNLSSVVQH